jgi:hypothetical protein
MANTRQQFHRCQSLPQPFDGFGFFRQKLVFTGRLDNCSMTSRRTREKLSFQRFSPSALQR